MRRLLCLAGVKPGGPSRLRIPAHVAATAQHALRHAFVCGSEKNCLHRAPIAAKC